LSQDATRLASWHRPGSTTLFKDVKLYEVRQTSGRGSYLILAKDYLGSLTGLDTYVGYLADAKGGRLAWSVHIVVSRGLAWVTSDWSPWEDPLPEEPPPLLPRAPR
jgi:hypothetical protein